MKRWICVGAVLLLVGCAAPMQAFRPSLNIAATFDKTEAERLLLPGNNVISGSALIRQRGGGVVTCAATPASLIPATAYARERSLRLFGSENGGFFSANSAPPRFDNDPADYGTLRKKVTCDAQGKFEFSSIPDGDFYVVAMVIWSSGPYSREGGLINSLVSVRGGEKANVVLAR